MSDYRDRTISLDAAGAVPVAATVNHVYGNTAIKLTRPSGKSMLVIMAEVGSWRLRLGDHVSSPPAAPTGNVTNGSGSILLTEGKSLVMPAPRELTVKTAGASNILTYYYL
jgi:hypothetical protein